LKAALGGRRDAERVFDRLGQTVALDMLWNFPRIGAGSRNSGRRVALLVMARSCQLREGGWEERAGVISPCSDAGRRDGWPGRSPVTQVVVGQLVYALLRRAVTSEEGGGACATLSPDSADLPKPTGG
jgi:hypothetical protein